MPPPSLPPSLPDYVAGGAHLHSAAGDGPGAGSGHRLLPLLHYPQDHAVSGSWSVQSSGGRDSQCLMEDSASRFNNYHTYMYYIVIHL